VFDATMQLDAENEWSADDRSLHLTTGLERSRQMVEIQTLGQFKVIIAGIPLRFLRKAQKKPMQLLKALIAFGGKEVREDMLAELLWPDADGDAAARALSTALYRLRKLLGALSVQRRNGALTLDSYQCRVDLWLLERLFNRLGEACRGGDVDSVATRAEQLLALHRGRFLDSEEDAPWAFKMRESVRSRLLRHLEMAARYLIRANRIDQAIACYERGLEIDPLLEALYRGLMQSYLSHERRAEALVTYHRCCRVLQAGLGIAPSKQTVALLQQVHAK